MSKKRYNIEKEILRLEKTDEKQFKELMNQYVGLQAKERETMKLKDLTEAQQKKLSVQHYNLHIPAYATKEQLQFIIDVSKQVIENKPITIVHEDAMKFLLRIVYTYRNILLEFDEGRRWTEADERDLVKVSKGFAPILEWLKEQYKLKIKEWEFGK